jgi:YgiT-type zinc finger domain-containing protein
MISDGQDFLIEERVNYMLELNGKFFLIENVPAHVNDESGEQFFDPLTVERLQKIILDGQEPDRVIEVPVYKYLS